MASLSALPKTRALIRIYVAGLALVVAVAGYDHDGVAAEWSITTQVNQRFELDDNIELEARGSDETFGSTTSPETRYRYRSPALDINVYGRLDFSRFNDDTYNTEDQTVRSTSAYTTERGVWALNTNLVRDSTRTSELEDTGRFGVIGTRVLYNLSPSYSYQVSQRNLVRVDLGYTGVSYDTTSLTGYKYYSGGAGWENALNQSTTLSLGLNAATQDSNNSVESDSYSLQVGIRHSFSPRLQVSGSAGPQYSEQKSPTDKQSGIGTQFAASVDYSYDPQTTVSASANQSVSPSSGGVSRERRSLRLSAYHRYLPRLSFLLTTYFQDDSDPNGNNASLDRTYISVSPSVRWQVTRDWDLSGSYQYRWQEQGRGSDASSNAVTVSLNYHPNAWFLAR